MPASFGLGAGDALQSQDERLILLHLVPSPRGLQPTQSLSPDPQSPEGAGWGCGVGRAAHKCTDPPGPGCHSRSWVLSGSPFAQLPPTGAGLLCPAGLTWPSHGGAQAWGGGP